MNAVSRTLVLVVLATTPAISAAQDELEAMRERLSKVEAEQERSMKTIESLRASLDSAGSVPIEPSTGQVMFPQLADEAQFVLRSGDGDFSLGLEGLIGGRYEVNHRREDGSGSSETDQGFELTATRFSLQGQIYGDWGYWTRFNADDFGNPVVDVAAGLYFLDDDTTVGFGQFPSTLTRDQGLPVYAIQAIDSSPTNYTFDPFGFKGVILGVHNPKTIFRAIVHDGYRSTNNSAHDASSADWGLGGQAVWMVVGDKDDWGRFDDISSRPDGGDFIWQLNGGFITQSGGEFEDEDGRASELSHLLIGESSMEGDGWNLYKSFFYRHSEDTYDASSADDIGFIVQAGTWATESIEAYSRYDMTIPDPDRTTTDGKFRTVTAGLGYYPVPGTNHIKLQSEFMYMFDSEEDSIVEPNDFSSVRDSLAGDQWVFRVQFLIRW